MKEKMWQTIRVITLLFLTGGLIGALTSGKENAFALVIGILVIMIIANFLFTRKIRNIKIAIIEEIRVEEIKADEQIRIAEREKANEQKKDS